MNRIAVVVFVAVCFAAVSPASGQGTMKLVGPADRAEGELPFGAGEFDVDIYAEDMPGFAGFQAVLELLLDGTTPTPGFLVALGGPATPFAGRKIVYNDVFLPMIQHAVAGLDTVGLMSFEEEYGPPPDYEFLGYTDKTIPSME